MENNNEVKMYMMVIFMIWVSASSTYALAHYNDIRPLVICLVTTLAFAGIIFYRENEQTVVLPPPRLPTVRHKQKPRMTLMEINTKLNTLNKQISPIKSTNPQTKVCPKCNKPILGSAHKYTTNYGKEYRLHPLCKVNLLSEAKMQRISGEKLLLGR